MTKDQLNPQWDRKTNSITEEVAQKIFAHNAPYLLWRNHNCITQQELIDEFELVQYEDGSWNLSHKKDDFYIEDIIYEPKITRHDKS